MTQFTDEHGNPVKVNNHPARVRRAGWVRPVRPSRPEFTDAQGNAVEPNRRERGKRNGGSGNVQPRPERG